ncbi:MAG: hypothetical protein KJ077_17570 [Anaerolineae bacterium]|nr:hypothetical protein [Anaerolineae bacterium]
MKIFEEVLKSQGIPFKLTNDGTYSVEVNGQALVVSLENVEKTYLRDKDPEIIRNFAATVLTFPGKLPNTWTEAKDRIRFSLEPAEFLVKLAGLCL